MSTRQADGASPIEPDDPTGDRHPQSRVRQTLSRHADTLAAVFITLAILGGAYFIRVLPQLRALEMQMQTISDQLITVDGNLHRIGENDLFRLRLTTYGLQSKMEDLVTQATRVQLELTQAELEGRYLNDTVAPLKATLADFTAAVSASTSAFGAPATYQALHASALRLAAALESAQAQFAPQKSPFPNVREAAEKLAGDLERAQARVSTAKQPFPEVRKAAEELAAAIAGAKRAIANSVPCKEIMNKQVLGALKKKGFCKG